MADPYSTIITITIKKSNKEYKILKEKDMSFIPETEPIIRNFLKDLNKKKIGRF